MLIHYIIKDKEQGTVFDRVFTLLELENVKLSKLYPYKRYRIISRQILDSNTAKKLAYILQMKELIGAIEELYFQGYPIDDLISQAQIMKPAMPKDKHIIKWKTTGGN